MKDILAYLQLLENPYYVAAFERIVNVPKRAIGVSHHLCGLELNLSSIAFNNSQHKLRSGCKEHNTPRSCDKGVARLFDRQHQAWTEESAQTVRDSYGQAQADGAGRQCLFVQSYSAS